MRALAWLWATLVILAVGLSGCGRDDREPAQAPIGTARSALAPSFVSLLPASGPAGTSTVIRGAGFTGTTAVLFGDRSSGSFVNGISATFTAESDGQITATVPLGSLSGAIHVLTPGGEVWTTPFAVGSTASPSVTSFLPTSLAAPGNVTVTGTGFTGTTAVAIGATPAAFFQTSSDTQLVIGVPVGAVTAKINVQNAAGSGSSAANLTVLQPPTVASFAPSAGKAGDSIVLTGTRFTGATGVEFGITGPPGSGGGTSALFTVNSATKITVTVPLGTQTGAIRVSTPAGSGDSATPFTIQTTVPPSVTGVNPSSAGNGAFVQVLGSGFSGTTGVSFNGASASQLFVTSDTSINVAVPPGATTGLVTVTNPAGQSSSPSPFTVIAPPSIQSGSPLSGFAGATVTLTGSGFTSVTSVSFGGTAAAFTVVNDTEITTVVPSGAGSSQIKLTAASGDVFSPFQFTVLGTAAPTVTGFSPTHGGPGVQVTLTGTGFTGTTQVSFSGNGSFGFDVVDDTHVQATVPSGAVTGPITVTNNVGSGISAASFLVPPPPTVTSFTPTSGKAGDTVAVTGQGFTSVALVRFAGAWASFKVVGDTSLSVVVPGGASSGPIEVGGVLSTQSFTVLSSAAPVINGFSPMATSVGSFTRLSGLNFTGTTAVLFNGVAAQNVGVESDTSLVAYVPQGASSGPITVQNTVGQAISAQSFTVLPPPTITSISPSSGTPGSTVTITGTELLGATGVTFGNGTPASFTVDGDTQITATVPVASMGSIAVDTPLGRAQSSAQFTVLGTAPPTITSFSPTQGGPGLQVTIVGTGFAGTNQVTFAGHGSFGFQVIDATHVQAFVPVGVQPGPISVTNNLGTATSLGTFGVTAPPTVGDFAPLSGHAGDSVVIHGIGFTGVSLVRFGGAWANFTVTNDTALTATVPDGASSGPIEVGGVPSATSFTVLSSAPPTISGFSPSSGSAGTDVHVDGANFTGTTIVSFNGVPSQNYFVNGDNRIDAVVPVGATTGPMSVTNSMGTAVTTSNFTVVPPPTLTSFAPAQGKAGDSVVLTGTGMAAVTQVYFSGTSATFTIDSSTQVTAVVPVGASSGPIGFNGGVQSSASFTVLSTVAPTVTGFSPSSGGPGTRISVIGTGFNGTTAVSFGSIAASFSTQSDGKLDVVVPLGASTGTVTVTNDVGSGTSTATFTVLVPPTITSFAPSSGGAGTVVSVTGTGFLGASQASFGPIGGVKTSVTVVDDSHLTTTVPSGASDGPITIDAPGGEVQSSTPFHVTSSALPKITGFQPTSGGVGTGVQISGSGFTGTTSVMFGGVPATLFGGRSDTEVDAVVPALAVTGPIVVTNGVGFATSTGDFVVDHSLDMTVTSVSPPAGKPGTVVTITGTNLGGVQVGFSPNGQASIVSDDGTTLVVTIPPAGTSSFLFIQRSLGSTGQIIAMPYTVYTPVCASSTVGVPCGLCSVCSAGGACTAPGSDDTGCGTIDCDGLDGVCGAFDDIVAGRCKAAGSCKAPNSADCVAITAAPAGVDCGSCASCNGTGACVADLSQDADCPACEECSGLGACAPAAAGTDAKNDCAAVPCHTGACDGGGACGLTPDGTTCNDGDACTKTDVCVAGACAGGNPVVCAASDPCHVAGTCDPSSGSCTNPTQLDGVACDDGVACTTGDACQAGACAPTASTCQCSKDADCVPLDQCHVAGVCQQSTRTCTNPSIADGTACDDGNACTSGEVCESGTCGTPSVAVTCSALDQCHDVGVCDRSTGKCSTPAKSDGTLCSDGISCTSGDSCQAGACVPSSNQCACQNDSQCKPLDQCHVAGTCDLASHLCSNPPAPDGAACNDANRCTSGEVCKAGACGTPATTVSCPVLDACHASGVCDPATSACSYAPVADGTVCPGGLCLAGACVESADAGSPDAAVSAGGAGAAGGASSSAGGATSSSDGGPSAGGAATNGAGGATTGAGGTATSGSGGTATSGAGGTATSGAGGTATSGAGGAATGPGGAATSGTGGTSSALDAAAPGTGGVTGDAGPNGIPGPIAGNKGGCGCHAVRSATDGDASPLLLVALVMLRRRSGRRRTGTRCTTPGRARQSSHTAPSEVVMPRAAP